MFSLFIVKTSLTAVFIMEYILLRSVIIVGTNIYINVLYDLVIYPLGLWWRSPFVWGSKYKAFSATYVSRLIDSAEDLHHNLGLFSFSYIHCGLQLEVKEWSVMQKNLWI